MNNINIVSSEAPEKQATRDFIFYYYYTENITSHFELEKIWRRQHDAEKKNNFQYE